MKNNLSFVYFGGEPIGAPVLDHLLKSGFKPDLVVTSPDRPAGRHKKLTPPPVKTLAEQAGVETLQPESFLKDDKSNSLITRDWDLFVVVAYNKILPEWFINLPKHKTINLHPSLLPKLRGPSPVRSAILKNQPEAVGVSIMLLDSQMDHGPIIAQETCAEVKSTWPLPGTELDLLLAEQGAKLLTKTIPDWINGKLEPRPQTHEAATYTSKFDKKMGELNIDPHQLPVGDEAFNMILKIYAFTGSPGTYFLHNNKRTKIVAANLTNQGALEITRVIPEGKKEMTFQSFLQSLDS